MKFLENKRVLVTGACGTIGSALVRLLLDADDAGPAEVIGIDNNESELFFIEQRHIEDSRARFMLADLRDKDKLVRVMRGVDTVFHAAALKHVVMCERSPYEAVQTNIQGVQNIILAAAENGVERVIFTSSDKAVNPTNVMGTSKLMGERIITAANNNQQGHGTIFASTRFGNVLGSNGSVIPIFHKQIAGGGPLTLTDPEMTRFIMTVDQAVRLVMNTAGVAQGGEVFITKMPVIQIRDLAEVMIDELAPVYGYSSDEIEIKEIGTKPGEKLYEELMSMEEIRRAWELDQYFVVLPAFRDMYRDIRYEYETLVSKNVDNPYTSSEIETMGKDELRAFLRDNKLLEPGPGIAVHPDKRYWPGDKQEQV